MTKPEPTPMRRQPKQQRSQQRVEKILQAAAEVFVEVGYEAATTHMIAAKAETSRNYPHDSGESGNGDWFSISVFP